MIDTFLFQGLSDSDIATFMLFTQERTLAMWDILFREGDDATAMYIVLQWDLKVYRERSSGLQVLGHVLSWDVVGEMALFDANAPKKRTATVQAGAETRILVIMDYAIIDLSRKQPQIYDRIVQVISDRNRKNQEC